MTRTRPRTRGENRRSRPPLGLSSGDGSGPTRASTSSLICATGSANCTAIPGFAPAAASWRGTQWTTSPSRARDLAQKEISNPTRTPVVQREDLVGFDEDAAPGKVGAILLPELSFRGKDDTEYAQRTATRASAPGAPGRDHSTRSQSSVASSGDLRPRFPATRRRISRANPLDQPHGKLEKQLRQVGENGLETAGETSGLEGTHGARVVGQGERKHASRQEFAATPCASFPPASPGRDG